MKYQNIRVGHFISRPNRFIAKIEIEGAEEIVHVKNTGRCAAEVYVQDSLQEAEDWLSDNELLQGEMQMAVSSKSTNIGKKRKTRWDLIAVRKGDRLINMDSQIPNKIVKEWLEQEKWNHNLHNQSDRIHGITKIQPEYTYGKSRIDLYVEAQNRKILIEVKGVTLEENGVVRFPDAPSERAVKHVHELKEALKEEIEKSKYEVIGCRYNNEYFNLNKKIEEDAKIELIDISDKEGAKIYRMTLVYIMGKAFESLYPKEKLTVEYQLGDAMFCKCDKVEITAKFIKDLKEKMQEIIEKDLKIEQRKMTREEAKEFYEKTNTSKGRLQFDFEENKIIDMYFCENYYNYSYEIIADTTGKAKVFDVVKYQDGFLIRYPSSKTPTEMSEFKDTKKLSWALEEFEKIHSVLDVLTVYKLNKAVEEGRIKDIIMLAEALHEKKIANIADDIKKRKNTKMVLIAGPSSSGKTTFAQRLGIQLRLNGIKPVTLSVDNYFVERQDTPRNENGEYNFECIEAIDLKLFNEHLVKLLNGEEIEVPEFDFSVGTKRYNGKKMRLAEDEILVIEGIHCLNDKLTSQIEKDKKYKIYISALTVLNMDRYNRISTTDTRLIRRIVRDYQFRSYSAIHTLNTWHQVTDGEEKNIFPFQEDADRIFNTSLIYELGALKPIAMPLLKDIKRDNVEYAEAQRLINILKYFREIPAEYVPDNSLLKEFIGGGTFGLH